MVYKCSECTENGGLSPSIVRSTLALQYSTEKFTGATKTLEKLENDCQKITADITHINT